MRRALNAFHNPNQHTRTHIAGRTLATPQKPVLQVMPTNVWVGKDNDLVGYV